MGVDGSGMLVGIWWEDYEIECALFFDGFLEGEVLEMLV